MDQVLYSGLVGAVLGGILGGAVAAWLTHRFNERAAETHRRWEEQRSTDCQKAQEEWELRKYEANQRLIFFRTFTELFYGAKSEVAFIQLDCRNLEAALNANVEEFSAIVAAQNPQLTPQQIAVQTYAGSTQTRGTFELLRLSRLEKYNASIKAVVARAEAELSMAEQYLSKDIHRSAAELLRRLNKVFPSNEDGWNKQLQEFENCIFDFEKLQKALLKETDSVLAIERSKAAKA